MSRAGSQSPSILWSFGTWTARHVPCHWLARGFPGPICSYLIACVRSMNLYEMLRRERARFVLGMGGTAA